MPRAEGVGPALSSLDPHSHPLHAPIYSRDRRAPGPLGAHSLGPRANRGGGEGDGQTKREQAYKVPSLPLPEATKKEEKSCGR